VTGAEIYNITYIGNSKYTIQEVNGDYLNIQPSGRLSFDSNPMPYSIYSVTYTTKVIRMMWRKGKNIVYNNISSIKESSILHLQEIALVLYPNCGMG